MSGDNMQVMALSFWRGGTRAFVVVLAFVVLFSAQADEPIFDLLARPGRLAQEREAGLHGRVILETPDRYATSHLTPTVPFNELIDDVFQRDPVQRIEGMGGRRCHVRVLHLVILDPYQKRGSCAW